MREKNKTFHAKARPKRFAFICSIRNYGVQVKWRNVSGKAYAMLNVKMAVVFKSKARDNYYIHKCKMYKCNDVGVKLLLYKLAILDKTIK